MRRQSGVRQGSSSLAHGLRALLHTVRCIKQHEDALCHLLHASEGAMGGDAALMEEVGALLEEMPSGEYMDDVEAVRAALRVRVVEVKKGGKAVGVQSKAVKRQRETVKVQSKAVQGRVKAKKAVRS